MKSADRPCLLDSSLTAGRKLTAADLELLILSLLASNARHGYEISTEIQNRTLGYYRPSPGVLYPALKHLRQAGLAVAEAAGGRKRYRMTPAGAALLEERRQRVLLLWDRLEGNGAKLTKLAAEPSTSAGVLRARALLDRALRAHFRAAPEDQLRIAQILTRAAADIGAIA